MEVIKRALAAHAEFFVFLPVAIAAINIRHKVPDAEGIGKTLGLDHAEQTAIGRFSRSFYIGAILGGYPGSNAEYIFDQTPLATLILAPLSNRVAVVNDFPRLVAQ